MKYNLNKITLFGYHGVSDYERENGQYFEINISYSDSRYKSIDKIKLNDDKLKNFIDYIDVYNHVKKIFLRKKYHLIETLTADIYTSLKNKYKIDDLKIMISKKHPDKNININEVTYTIKEK